MKLVIDANILFSFFRENPVRFIIINSNSFGLEPFSPEYSLEELKHNVGDMVKYTKSEPEQIEEAVKDLRKFVITVSSDGYKEFESDAKQLSPHDKDAPYFALALKLSCAIWSNESRLKRQPKVKVLSTSDLLRELGLKL